MDPLLGSTYESQPLSPPTREVGAHPAVDENLAAQDLAGPFRCAYRFHRLRALAGAIREVRTDTPTINWFSELRASVGSPAVAKSRSLWRGGLIL